jgi:hypothetical protein
MGRYTPWTWLPATGAACHFPSRSGLFYHKLEHELGANGAVAGSGDSGRALRRPLIWLVAGRGGGCWWGRPGLTLDAHGGRGFRSSSLSSHLVLTMQASARIYMSKVATIPHAGWRMDRSGTHWPLLPSPPLWPPERGVVAGRSPPPSTDLRDTSPCGPTVARRNTRTTGGGG